MMPELHNTLFIMHTSTHLAMGTRLEQGIVLAGTMTGLHLETAEPFMEAATICSSNVEVESVDVTRLRQTGTE